jgi:replicative DNA helicase
MRQLFIQLLLVLAMGAVAAPITSPNGKISVTLDGVSLKVCYKEQQALDIVEAGITAPAAPVFTQHIKAEIEAFTAASEVKTGFSRFDQLAGGLFPALYVIGAISSLGKTTFIHQMADQLAAAGKHVLFFSLEMSRLELATKSIARRTAQMDYSNALTSLKIRRGIKSNLLVQAVAAYCKAVEDRLCIIEGGFETTVQYIREYAKQYAEKHSTRPVIIVDYLQILQGAQKGTLREAVDFNVVELKRLSRDLNTPVIVVSSVNRSNYLLPVDFESFKESGGIEYTADVVLGMQLACLEDPIFENEGKDIAKKRERVKQAKAADPREVKLVCLKNRYGGPDWTIDYKYYPRYDLFEEQDGFTVVSEKTPFDD